MPDAGLFIVIDQSTSATKAMLFSCEGSLIDQEALTHAQIYPRPGWVEQDAEQIFQNTLTVSAKLLAGRPASENQPVALSITNQRETFVVFAKETGRPLYHAIVWQCTRGEE